MQKSFVTIYLFVSIASKFVICNCINFNGKISGYRTISRCINGPPPTIISRDPQMYITTSGFIGKMGYPAEDHVVQTDDGHILTLHRIPSKKKATPVLLQHGLLGSSFDWVVTGKENALAFKLADAGYDVWLGNVRGNTYSRCHTRYKTSSRKFWDFSWHEIGVYDLPAMITHVEKTTGQQLIYVGHSMGTTSFYVMAIERPDIASKVKLMFSFAPVAFIDHATSPLRLLSTFTRQLEFYTKVRGTAEILSQNPILKKVIKYACTLTMLQRKVCINFLFSTFGFDSHRFNYTLTPDLLYHTPAGSSLKNFIHYYQERNSGKFQYYDYGAKRNFIFYNNTKPPEYNISKIRVPIGIFWSDGDAFANPIDVKRLYNQLPNTILYYHIDYPKFNHLDYLYAIDAPKYVYWKLLSVMENYK